MATDRRTFLRLGAAFAAGFALPAALRAEDGRALFIAAAAEPDGSFAAVVLDEDGRRLAAVPVATRGHDAAADPVSRRWVLFARRPGRFAIVVDADGRAPPLLFAPPADRHFNGHGAFSADGRLLYATENDFAAVRGVLGIYDAGDGFRRVGELPTHGVGPHEVILGRAATLIVANGGIATDPDYGKGRQPLNLATMAPSLAVIDAATGDLRNRVELPADLHQLSIRHLALDAFGAVWFGCQWEGDPVEHPPLVGRLAGDRPPRLVELPPRTLFRARNYVGALAASRDGSLIAASCPRGGSLLAFDAATGTLVEEALIDDSSGIAPSGDGFLATSGGGKVARFGRDGITELAAAGERYDNHLRRLG